MPELPDINPMEVPNPSELWKHEGKKDFEKSQFNEIWFMENEWNAALAVKIGEKNKPTVLLSWKKNLKVLTNWMRKHMEAYPETSKWFLVQFIDGNWNRWYEVRVCDRDEESLRINWIWYKILPYRFEWRLEIQRKINENTNEKIGDVFREES